MDKQTNIPGGMAFHLALEAMLWWCSNAALQHVKHASPPWSQNWPNIANASFPPPFGWDQQAFEQAVQDTLTARRELLAQGLQRYHQHDHQYSTAHEIIWQEGASSLRHYPAHGKTSAPALFIVPSLINKPSILDLAEERSFIGHMTGQGIPVYLLDWGNPGAEESGFRVEDYITQRLLPAYTQAKHPLVMVGYCMGGLLAMAAAQLLAKDKRAPQALALMATPWDYHTPDFPRVKLDSPHLGTLETILTQQPTIPGHTVQMLFYLTNPWVFSRKFMHLATIDANSEAEENFLLRENWVNDTVDMTADVARECLIDWIHHNGPMQGQWQIQGETISPNSIAHLPSLLVMPQHDHVVPGSCAAPLAQHFPDATILRPDCGHIGMVAGTQAAELTYTPFADWVKNLG